jgi:GTP pyrophosphokinase
MAFALSLHGGQERKGSRVPYMGHLLGTAAIVLHFGANEDQGIAALLHDAAEDQGGRPTLDAIVRRFGDRVAEIVEGCTDTFEDPKPDWRPRKEAYVARIPNEATHILLVSAADKLDSARAIVADLRVARGVGIEACPSREPCCEV